MQNTQALIAEFEQILRQQIETAWSTENLTAHLGQLTEGSERLQTAIMALGDHAYETLKGPQLPPDQSQALLYFINYQWAEQAKAFLILWRDVLFEQQKGQLLLAGEEIEEAAVRRQKAESADVVREAAGILSDMLNRESREKRSRRFGIDRSLRTWQQQQNPWPVYREQLEQVPRQCRQLMEDHQKLLATSQVFNQIRRHIFTSASACRNEIDDIAGLLRRAIKIIEEELNKEGPQGLGKIAARLEDLDAEHELHNQLLSFNNTLEHQIEELPEKMEVVVDTQEGLLEKRILNMRRRVQQWLESEIIPLLYEIWELTQDVNTGLKMTLMNSRNRALLLAAEAKEVKQPDFEQSDLSQPLQLHLPNTANADATIANLMNLAERRLDKDFHLTQIYETAQEFLPLPLQSTLNQLRLNQNRVLTKARNWLLRQTVALRRFRRSVAQEQALSLSEKIVRYINSREGDPENSHYTAIFETRGYIGDAFAVGRREELRHAGRVIEQWQNGFRGALAITGQRLSGKSFFGELLLHRYFPDTGIRLSPGATVRVQGRKMEATYDLQQALEFVRKYAFNIRPLIWIDDLELWWEPGRPLFENVRALAKFIDSYADDIFFAVTLNNATRSHLQYFLDIDSVFQARISMDRMPVQDIRDAIAIRHGATHQQLIDKEKKEVPPQQFANKINLVYKSSRANIGEALMRWSSAIRYVDDERVGADFSERQTLPDFLSPDSAMLLSSIMMQKRTNEYRLRKLFGPAFAAKYRSLVQRLINTGILRRQVDGWLEINELVVNDLGYLLERKQHIKYR